MKRTKIIFMSAVFWALGAAFGFAQLATVDLALNTFMQVSHAENAIKYAQMIAEQVKSVQQAYDQFQNMLRMEKMALDNLKSAGNIESFSDFKNWYNRQLYLEKQAEDKFTKLNVKIGNSNYKLQDVKDIPNAMQDQFNPHQISEELSEQERKAMWLKLGLSPANYAYRQVWKERESKLIKLALTKREIKNEEDKADAEKYDALLKSYEEDSSASEEARIKDKTLQMQQNALLVDKNKKLSGIQDELAAANEMNAVNAQKNMEAPAPLGLSETYKRNVFNDKIEGMSITEED